MARIQISKAYLPSGCWRFFIEDDIDSESRLDKS